MKIFFAEITTSGFENYHNAGVTNFLVSFYYQKKTALIEKILELNPKANIFYDSGAYSAMTQNETIDMKDYCESIKQYEKHLEVISALDVIGSASETKKNYDYMLSRKDLPQDKIIPVFHSMEDPEYLKYYCSKSNFIASGGLTIEKLNSRMLTNSIEYMLSLIPKGKKVHLFGVTSHAILMRFGGRIYSADSASSNRRLVYTSIPNVSGMMKATPGMEHRIDQQDVKNLQTFTAGRLLKVEREVNEYWSRKNG